MARLKTAALSILSILCSSMEQAYSQVTETPRQRNNLRSAFASRILEGCHEMYVCDGDGDHHSKKRLICNKGHTLCINEKGTEGGNLEIDGNHCGRCADDEIEACGSRPVAGCAEPGDASCQVLDGQHRCVWSTTAQQLQWQCIYKDDEALCGDNSVCSEGVCVCEDGYDAYLDPENRRLGCTNEPSEVCGDEEEGRSCDGAGEYDCNVVTDWICNFDTRSWECEYSPKICPDGQDCEDGECPIIGD